MTKIFKDKFASYVCEGDTLTATTPDGYEVTAMIYRDDSSESPEDRQDGFWPSLDPKADGYIGRKSPATLAKHTAHAHEVMRSWRADEWFYCGVAVTVSKAGIELTGKYNHAVWGCDCNFPTYRKRDRATRNDYLSEYAEDNACEALTEARAKVAELAASKLEAA